MCAYMRVRACVKLGENQLRLGVIYLQMGDKQTDYTANEGEKQGSTEYRSVGEDDYLHRGGTNRNDD